MKDSFYSAKPGNIFAVLQDEMPEEEEVIKPPTSLVDMPDEILVKIFRLALNTGHIEANLDGESTEDVRYDSRGIKCSGICRTNFNYENASWYDDAMQKSYNQKYSRVYRTAGFKFNKHLWEVAQEEFINTNVFVVQTYPRVCRPEKVKKEQPCLCFRTATGWFTDFCLRLQSTLNTIHEATSQNAQCLKDLVHVDFKLDHGLHRGCDWNLLLLAEFAEFVAPRLKFDLPRMKTLSLWIHGEDINQIAEGPDSMAPSEETIMPAITRIIEAFMAAKVPLVSVSTTSYAKSTLWRDKSGKVQDAKGWSAGKIAQELCEMDNFFDLFELK